MEIIDNILNTFMENPYSNEYLQHKIYSSHYDPENIIDNSIFSKRIVKRQFEDYKNGKNLTEFIINEDTGHIFAFAMKSLFNKTVLCKIKVGGDQIHSFIIEPDEIAWILDGMPFLFIDVKYHHICLFFYNTDGSELENVYDENIIIYYSFIPSDFIRYESGHACNLKGDEYYISNLNCIAMGPIWRPRMPRATGTQLGTCSKTWTLTIWRPSCISALCR